MTRFRAALAAVLVVLIASTLSVRSTLAGTFERNQPYEDVYYLPPQKSLKALTLEYHAAAADLIWMRSLLYFGKELIQRGQTRYLFSYIDAMLTLDPDFRSVYLWSAMAGLYHSGTVTVDDGYRVVGYLERAADRWPDDGEIAWELGAALRFEIAPMVKDPLEKQRLHEASMGPLSTAARLGAGPPWLAGLNAQLLKKLGHTEQAIRHLEEMYDTVQDSMERKRMGWELARLRSESYAAAFQAATEQLSRERQQNYPYLSTNLFVVLGPRQRHTRNRLLERGFIPDDLVLADESLESDSVPETE